GNDILRGADPDEIAVRLDAVVERLAPVRERALALLDDPAELDRILAAGAEKARAVATPVLEDVYAKVGFLPPLR
ncbi:hypothetical protein GUG96_19490, partial [Xanthomonas citri pv. citri]|nr:hypothetical protein [Xanthomonas citri pv. citri]